MTGHLDFRVHFNFKNIDFLLTLTAFKYQYAGKSYDLLSCRAIKIILEMAVVLTVFGALLLSEIALSSLRMVRTIVNLSLK